MPGTLRTVSLAAGVTIALAQIAVAAVGDVDRAAGQPGVYRLVTGETSGEIIRLPDGLANLRRVEGQYQMRHNPNRISNDAVMDFGATFCGHLGRTANTGFGDRIAVIECR